jgi:hypothetical protein
VCGPKNLWVLKLSCKTHIPMLKSIAHWLKGGEWVSIKSTGLKRHSNASTVLVLPPSKAEWLIRRAANHRVSATQAFVCPSSQSSLRLDLDSYSTQTVLPLDTASNEGIDMCVVSQKLVGFKTQLQNPHPNAQKHCPPIHL